MMSPSTTAHRSDERALECTEAIAPAFQMLVRQAEDAGWTKDEVLVAIHELSTHAFLYDQPTQLH